MGVLVGVSVSFGRVSWRIRRRIGGCWLGVSVGVLVGVSVGVFVGVSVGVLVGVSVGVLVGVSVGVFVGVSVGVLVVCWWTDRRHSRKEMWLIPKYMLFAGLTGRADPYRLSSGSYIERFPPEPPLTNTASMPMLR